MEKFICKYCGKECKNKNSLAQHEIRCKENPNRIKSGFELYNESVHVVWNKGLSKNIDNRILQQSNTLKQSFELNKINAIWKGKHLSKEHREKISKSQSQYYLEHPDKIPYKLWHSSEISYPEKYFIEVFNNENIDVKYHLQVGLYELDFYNENKKKYIEIDGGTHYKKKVQEIDKRKDNYLNSLGWKVFRVKWDEYKKLSYEEKHKIVENIRSFILN